MNSIMTKDSSVATENGKNTTQVSCGKCFYVATKFSAWSHLKEEFLSQQKKSCRDITFIIHNKEQQNLCRDEDYLCRDKQNMREVNSLSRQKIEEQHKRNSDKEIHVTTK